MVMFEGLVEFLNCEASRVLTLMVLVDKLDIIELNATSSFAIRSIKCILFLTTILVVVEDSTRSRILFLFNDLFVGYILRR